MDHLNSPWPVVLSIAGFDPSAGAGILADTKTFAAHNCYGVAAITAMTVQNSQGVSSVHPVDSSLLRETLLSLLAYGRVKALKIGMLCNKAIAEVVCEILESNPSLPSVLDPVLRSSTDFDLLDGAGWIISGSTCFLAFGGDPQPGRGCGAGGNARGESGEHEGRSTQTG